MRRAEGRPMTGTRLGGTPREGVVICPRCGIQSKRLRKPGSLCQDCRAVVGRDEA